MLLYQDATAEDLFNGAPTWLKSGLLFCSHFLEYDFVDLILFANSLF